MGVDVYDVGVGDVGGVEGDEIVFGGGGDFASDFVGGIVDEMRASGWWCWFYVFDVVSGGKLDDIVDDCVVVDVDDVWLGREVVWKGGVDVFVSRIDVRDVYAFGEFDRYVVVVWIDIDYFFICIF